jgi:uncharacterized protein (DUF2147 family)
MKSETKTYAAMGLLAVALGCLTAVDVWAQNSSPLLGDWRAEDGSAVARVAPCRQGAGLCATVIEERPAPDEEATLGQVMVRNLVPSRNAWTGVYGSQDQSLAARVRLLNPNRIELRVCVNILLCETARYERVAR